MYLIFATWCGAEYQGRILTELGAQRRLISYFELVDHPPQILTQYCTHGKAGKPKKAKTA